MALSASTRLGPYEILSPLGAGGMGEVYRAKDTRLDRTVAIKVLPSHLSSDPERRQRFEREARAVSSLNHPHICTLHDIGHQDGVDFLVMEYLEGETLAERLATGPLPADQGLRYAVEIADALDRAHRQGIIHRDLKPGNIMLTKSGAKLLDFGLAKLRHPDASSPVLSGLPTEKELFTGEGAILGTLQYMAPEQLEGREVDARTDIFAFGAVVYEMLTGQRAFQASSQASLIAAILQSNPPSISALEPTTTPALDRAIKKCLAKDPEERWQSAQDLASEIRWITDEGLTAPAAMAGKRWETGGRFAWALTSLAILVALGLAFVHFREQPIQAETIRFSVVPGERSEDNPEHTAMAVSPDGRRLAFMASNDSGGNVLWVRALDSFSAQSLTGTEGATSPFWSPDGRFVGFFSNGKLKKIEASGGFPQTICDASGSSSAAWGGDGTILIAYIVGVGSGLRRVSATAGTSAEATKLDASRQDLAHFWPHFLPDGRHFLFVALRYAPTSASESHSVCLGSLDSSETEVLFQANSLVAYTAPGYLLFVRDGVLLAQPFDPIGLKVAGEARPVAEQIDYFKPTGLAAFSASQNGTLAYQTGSPASQLTWFDRSGKETGKLGAPGSFDDLRLSPDGRKVAVGSRDPRTGTTDVWIYELSRDMTTRLTFSPTSEFQAVWSPDGRSLVFADDRDGPPDLFQKSIGGAGGERFLLKAQGVQLPLDWSRDGRYLAYENWDPNTRADVWILPLGGEQKPFPLLRSAFNEEDARISPDSRWIAYVSDESGRPEVYVQSFPRAGETWRVSAKGGSRPIWRADGRELYYLAADRQIMAAPVKSALTFEAGTPTALFKADSIMLDYYDVTPDGQRFLVDSSADRSRASPINIVVNWPAGLKK